MPKNFLVLVLLGLTLLPLKGAAVDFVVMNPEKTFTLKIGLSAEKVKTILQEKPRRGEDQFWGADGQYHQAWKFPQNGILLDMVSKKKSGPKSIASIKVSAPSKFKIAPGIGLGSSFAEVSKVYKSSINQEESQLPETLVVGSIYDGMIFTFEKGQVTEIFIGAAAE